MAMAMMAMMMMMMHSSSSSSQHIAAQWLVFRSNQVATRSLVQRVVVQSMLCYEEV
jgi:hypothetical protein